MLLFRKSKKGAWVGLAALAALLAAGCRADTAVAPRTPPIGVPMKLVPAPVEQHPRATPHSPSR